MSCSFYLSRPLLEYLPKRITMLRHSQHREEVSKYIRHLFSFSKNNLGTILTLLPLFQPPGLKILFNPFNQAHNYFFAWPDVCTHLLEPH
jgi:hypothetical protein